MGSGMEIEKDWGGCLFSVIWRVVEVQGSTENSYDTTDSLGDLVLETTELGNYCLSRL